MSREKGGYTPKEIKKLEKSREKSDIELMKGGAELNERGELLATEDQKERAYAEMKKEIKKKTIEEHTNWIQRHPEAVGTALSFLGAGSFGALVLAADKEVLPDAINHMPMEVAYAIITLQLVATLGGAVLTQMSRGLSEKWKTRALTKGEAAKTEKEMKAKLQNARERQGKGK